MLGQLPELIDSLDERRDLWGDEWDALQAAAAGLKAGRFAPSNWRDRCAHSRLRASPRLPVRCWPGAFFPGRNVIFWRLSEMVASYDFRYERPRYAWADTVVRPILAPPDGGSLARALGPEWTSEGLPGMTGICGTERSGD